MMQQQGLWCTGSQESLKIAIISDAQNSHICEWLYKKHLHQLSRPIKKCSKSSKAQLQTASMVTHQIDIINYTRKTRKYYIITLQLHPSTGYSIWDSPLYIIVNSWNVVCRYTECLPLGVPYEGTWESIADLAVYTILELSLVPV